jgi:hypothetical protein
MQAMSLSLDQPALVRTVAEGDAFRPFAFENAGW